MNPISEKIKELITPLLTEKKFELYDVEYKKENSGWVLRIFVDNHTKSISLDECADVSNLIDPVLDQHEELELNNYNLEVSSPGLDRLLRNDGDYNWAMGKTLKVKFTNEDKKEVAEGKLQKFDADTIELSIGIGKKAQNIVVKRDSIESARRVMKFDELLPKNYKDKEISLEEDNDE